MIRFNVKDIDRVLAALKLTSQSQAKKGIKSKLLFNVIAAVFVVF